MSESVAPSSNLDSLDARTVAWPSDAQFQLGDRVTTPRKPFWIGPVCGWYRNSDGQLGFNVEADAIPGSIHNYPQSGLRALVPTTPGD